MATLHMDTHAVESIIHNLNHKKQDLENEISSLRAAMNAVVGDEWRAQSANDFLVEMGAALSQLQHEVNELGRTIDGIGDEVQKWKAFAESLGL